MNEKEIKSTLDLAVSLLSSALEVRTAVLAPGSQDWESLDYALRKSIFTGADLDKLFRNILEKAEEKTIYSITDQFYSHYTLMRLPAEAGAGCLLAGPYITEEIDETVYHRIISQNRLTQETLPVLKRYCQSLSIADPAKIVSAFRHIANYLYQDDLDLAIRYMTKEWNEQYDGWNYIHDPEHAFSAHMTEKRYLAENELLEAVIRGDQALAVQQFEAFIQYRIAPRYNDPLRDCKNLTIVLNTLLRKAAEKAMVHPVYLDEISHHYAIRIENSASTTQLESLRLEMIRKYCLLVKNQSLKNYPPLIRSLLNHINLNLSSQLSLKSLAQTFNVNASYLSSLFHQKIGMTLTEYVNSCRIDTAIKLLNATDMPIQDIAYYIGIEDVNYFSRMFRKRIGVSPTEYKKSIRPPGSCL